MFIFFKYKNTTNNTNLKLKIFNIYPCKRNNTDENVHRFAISGEHLVREREIDSFGILYITVYLLSIVKIKREREIYI